MLKINELGKTNSILNNFISEIRNVDIQNDRMRFRSNLQRIGEMMAYEISKTLDYKPVNITTPLGIKEMMLPCDDIVLATIFRAGIPMHQGFLGVFDKADNAFIAAYRKYQKGDDFNIMVEYCASAALDDKVLILIDPMIATGSSLILCLNRLLENGEIHPKSIHLACAIASKEGVEYVKENINGIDATLWTVNIDDELTAKSYIVPGLGDAGDLAYGPKGD
ncbi:MAG: uracil phosphoribosyltransferase [Bacteroidales bacterium]|nr:uracil phosphoribosyltransferase [Bacteroidales bacterium]